MLGTGAKRLLEAALLASGLPSLTRRRRAGRTLILAYHNIVPVGEPVAGERSLHLPQERFGAQLDALLVTHHVVPLADVLHRPSSSPRPRAVITWDDAYHGAVTAGVAEVARRGLPATVFVCPGRVGGRAFWWDRLAEGQGGSQPDAVRRRALGEFMGDDRLILSQWAREAVAEAVIPRHARSATEAELETAAATPGISLGAHSWSHPNLARIPTDRLRHELEETKRWLEARFPGAIPWIAYPYGCVSDDVRSAVRRAGYRGGCLISGGWVSDPSGDPWRLPRLHVPAGLSLRGFALRLAGLFC